MDGFAGFEGVVDGGIDQWWTGMANGSSRAGAGVSQWQSVRITGWACVRIGQLELLRLDNILSR